MPRDPLRKEMLCGCNGVIPIVRAGDCFSKFGKVIDYDQKAVVSCICCANFHVIELNKIIETRAGDVLQWEANVASGVADFLASITMLDILGNVTFDAGPSVPFLNPLQDFGYALMARFVMSIEKDFLLIQLWHHNHAWTRVQGSLFLGITNAKNVVLVDEQ